MKLPDGTVKVLVEGLSRVKIKKFTEQAKFMEAEVEDVQDIESGGKELSALSRSVLMQFEQYVKLNRKIPPEVLVSINQMEDISKMSDAISSHLSLKLTDRQHLLETTDLKDRLELLFSHMEAEIGILYVEKKIRRRVKRQMEKSQREYYLNEQMKAIQKELGEEDELSDLKELEAKISKTKLSSEAREKANSELKKLKNMSLMSAEATVIRNYLDWILGVPWNKKSKVRKDISAAKKILDEDHYGLDKVKERILEYLAVQQKTEKIHGPILCLVGPPGVGKTSLGQSIAKATGRNFVRVSLGGMRDEAEIRGHRRTYIGALPGKIIQSMKKAKTSNPLFLLDEIDKLGNDWRGDPSSALLEVLDPEQNNSFNDHYLEVDYDLSDVLFITTANTLKMPRPLMDRMEIIRLSGYTEEEKIEIAHRHLIPKQRSAAGLSKREWSIDDEALRDLIRFYTQEAGVRNLERELASLARKATKELLENQGKGGTKKSVKITSKNLSSYAGVPKYTFGLNLGAEYAGFDFSMLIQGVAHVNSYLSGYSGWAFYGEGNIQKWQMEECWNVQTDNRYPGYPRLEVMSNAGSNNTLTSDFWLLDGSYVKVRNIQLGYTLPQTVVKKFGASGLRLYVSMDNPLSFNKFHEGWDPENGNDNGNYYPIMSTYTFGLTLNF